MKVCILTMFDFWFGYNETQLQRGNTSCPCDLAVSGVHCILLNLCELITVWSISKESQSILHLFYNVEY